MHPDCEKELCRQHECVAPLEVAGPHAQTPHHVVHVPKRSVKLTFYCFLIVLPNSVKELNYVNSLVRTKAAVGSRF